MLLTELKPKEEIVSFLQNKKNIFAVQCYGCKEVIYPDEWIRKFLNENNINSILMDYLCNHEYSDKYIDKYEKQITDANLVLIFSCGVGVQSFSEILYNSSKISTKGKQIIAGCDTLNANGFQGITTTELNCAQCGVCYLNYTGVICPITNCSKSLLNGPCGGSKGGKCEVDKEMDCGWEKIYHQIEKLGRQNMKNDSIKVRDCSKIFGRAGAETSSRLKVERSKISTNK